MSKHYSKTTGGFYCDDVHTSAQLPNDAVEISDADYQALLNAQAQGQVITGGADGKPLATARAAPTPAQVAAALSAAVQRHLDSTARVLGYDNILAAISYANEPAEPKFQADGMALRAWRSTVWAAANVVLNAVSVGGVAPDAADLVASLPKFTAPA